MAAPSSAVTAGDGGRPNIPHWLSMLSRSRPTANVSLSASAVIVVLVYVAAASGGELSWRKPKLPSAPAAASNVAAKVSAPVKESSEIRRVEHQEEVEGPRLLPAGDEQKEPRKLRSVLVRHSISERAEPHPHQQEGFARSLSLPQENVLRAAARDHGEPASGQLLEADPFEKHAVWTSRIKQSFAQDAAPVRLAQNEVEDGTTRSVLVRDPFEESHSGTSPNRASDRFISQPMPLDGADTAQPLREFESDPGFGGQPQDDDPLYGYAQDRSLEAERARADETCKEALQELERDRISTIDLAIRVPGEVGVDVPFECSLDIGEYEPRDWSDITFMWKASALCHKPLYFEDVQLERYGHSWGWHLQPFVSAAHFFTTVPILPYKMGLTPPNECIYALGYYRPGNCAPYLLEPLGTHPRAVVWQTGAIVGAAAIVP